MNKEKIGLYTEDEIFDYMTDCEGSMLGRSMYDAIFEKIHTQEKETTNLKQALNEIRKLIETRASDENGDIGINLYASDSYDILQIIDKVGGNDEKN